MTAPATETPPKRTGKLLQAIGPGLLMAGAAVGVSHLVQSTRAGEMFGFQLIGVVILANLLKYPFFEAGHRYPAATGETVVAGYERLGRGWLWAFFVLNIFSGIISLAGVTIVTAGLAEALFGIALGPTVWSGIILLICLGIIMIGHYQSVDWAVKVIMVVLAIATVTAVVIAVQHGSVKPPDFETPNGYSLASLGFLIALMGWMPAPVEISVFQSLWMDAKAKQTGHRCSMGEAAVDFNIGYIGTAVLAVLFVILGAVTLHGSGEEIATGASGFARQLISLYTETMGAWTWPIIAIAAMTTMFSTTLTVADGYPRGLSQAQIRLFAGSSAMPRRWHWIWVLIVAAGAMTMIAFLSSHMPRMIDLITTMAFLVAPFFAFLNFRLVTSKHMPAECRPGIFLRILSWLGLAYLIGFGLLFITWKIGWVG